MFKLPEVVPTLEEAIRLARENQEEYRTEWYSLGKTNADLRQYIKEQGIDTKALRVFIGGSEKNDPTMKVLVCPRSWMAVDDNDRAH